MVMLLKGIATIKTAAIAETLVTARVATVGTRAETPLARSLRASLAGGAAFRANALVTTSAGLHTAIDRYAVPMPSWHSWKIIPVGQSAAKNNFPASIRTVRYRSQVDRSAHQHSCCATVRRSDLIDGAMFATISEAQR